MKKAPRVGMERSQKWVDEVWVGRKGGLKMAWKGGDEGGNVGVPQKVGFVMAKEDCGETAGDVIASGKLENG